MSYCFLHPWSASPTHSLPDHTALDLGHCGFDYTIIENSKAFCFQLLQVYYLSATSRKCICDHVWVPLMNTLPQLPSVISRLTLALSCSLGDGFKWEERSLLGQSFPNQEHSFLCLQVILGGKINASRFSSKMYSY